MANTPVRDASNNTVYLQSTGTGTSGDPYIPSPGGNVAHDAVDAGNPLKIGGKAASALPTAVANLDRVDAYLDIYGRTHAIVGGIQVAKTATPTVSNAVAYTAGDALGGKITLTTAVRLSGGSGKINTIILTDLDSQNSAVDVVFFNADPTGTTFTDNAALDVADADLVRIVGVVPLVAGDYVAFLDNSVATKRDINLGFVLNATTSLFACLVARGTPTYTSTSAVSIIVEIEQD